MQNEDKKLLYDLIFIRRELDQIKYFINEKMINGVQANKEYKNYEFKDKVNVNNQFVLSLNKIRDIKSSLEVLQQLCCYIVEIEENEEGVNE